jgi:uncharacterized protein (TIGR04255 family)
MARSRRPAGLPDFENPPLTEVALSIQFEALSPIEFVDLGPLWSGLVGRYPNVEQHPPLAPAFEIFGMPPAAATLQFQLSAMPDVPRFWFVNEAGTEVLQIQPDRFIHNWRKVGEGEQYPRYERIRRTFLSEFSRLSRIIENRHAKTPTPNQCEVTYVNQVPITDANTSVIQKTLAILRIPDDFPAGSSEDAGMQIRFVLPGQDGRPIGRLIVQAGSAVTPKGVPVFQLMLTVRGRPFTPDLTGARQFMDMGRKVIVESFAALTTEQMHKVWGRRK